jgi:hypothetical protein
VLPTILVLRGLFVASAFVPEPDPRVFHSKGLFGLSVVCH